ncbi:hypothetical protein IH879_06760 [candidate division KSB1 bacterium]|nr:hypothetical protein [candidate division KSB1 bacterium]
MFQISFKRPIVVLLIFSLLSLQIIPALANGKKIKVAFVGLQFEHLPQEVRERVLQRVEDLLSTQSSIHLMNSKKVEELLGAETVAKLLKHPEQNDFFALASELQADYIFGGNISNNAREGEKILLVGELYRYDRASNLRHKFEILKYYDNIGVELIKFKEEFVKSIVGEARTGLKILPVLVLGGIVLAGILSFAFISAKGGAGGGGIPDPDPPNQKR